MNLSLIFLCIQNVSLLTLPPVQLFQILFFYNVSANLKNFYLELKSQYTTDGKYLAVVTKNGLWIRDKINDKTLVINSSKIENNFLIGNFITEFGIGKLRFRFVKQNNAFDDLHHLCVYKIRFSRKIAFQGP